jgi:beta-phosphoglucomutase-like phosphatase (HAD superfamily)
MSTAETPLVSAVVFDLDGVLVDTEPVWADAKRELTLAAGGRWLPEAPVAMLGMSGPEWSRYMHDQLSVPLEPAEIRHRVVDGVLRRLADGVPLIAGAGDAVRAIAAHWPVGLASSADRPVIDAVLEHTGLADVIRVSVSSDEAGAGKPAPDVYLAAAAGLGVKAETAVAIEDSANGMRAAKAAGMGLIAIPNPHAPLDDGALAIADVVLDSIAELTPAVVEAIGRPSGSRGSAQRSRS